MPNTYAMRQRREALGLTQREVGVLAGLVSPQMAVSQAERHNGTHAVVVAQVLSAIEKERGIRPPRDYRLFDRRIALGMSPLEVGELAGFPVGEVGGSIVLKVERGDGTPEQVEQVRRAILFEETRDRRRRENHRREAARVLRQEALWNALPASPAKDALLAAMLERCLELMHEGNGEACDAIAEWLPEPAVRAMFDRWEAECLADRKCAACEPSAIDFGTCKPATTMAT